ncbi:MAG: aquaporin [Gammaproteobacteria bacterium]|nr:aquaporin [SAR86 cluster bacterium]
MLKKSIAELFGTASLVSVVIGSGIMAERLAAGNEAIMLLANSFATFLGLFFLITILGRISAQFNPAVSMVLLFEKKISNAQFLIFGLFQILGALVGAVVTNFMFDLDPISLAQKSRYGVNLWFSEIIATAMLIIVILSSPPKKVAIMVASYIGAAYWFTASTSFANPAVTFGRIFSDTFTGIYVFDALYFMLAQILGAILGLFFYRYLFK